MALPNSKREAMSYIIDNAVAKARITSTPISPVHMTIGEELACIVKLAADKQAIEGERVGLTIDALHAAWSTYEADREAIFGGGQRSTSRQTVYSHIRRFARQASPDRPIKFKWATGRLGRRCLLLVPDMSADWEDTIANFCAINRC